jgi:RNA polymerase sigma-70 factor (ECF subfamily)
MYLFKQKQDFVSFSDEELVRHYKSKHEHVFISEIYKRYSHLIFLVCVKYLKDRDAAKDAVMDIFEELIEKLPNQTISYFKGWIYTVTRNHCLMKLRKEKKTERLEDVFDGNNHDFMETNNFLHLTEEDNFLSKTILEKLELLKGNQKKCLKSFYFDKRAYKEISEKENISEKKVKSYIQNGKRNLRLLLEKSMK